MRVAHNFEFSRPPLQPVLFSLVVLGAVLFAFALVRNPVAVALPIAGTVAATAMVWSIDQLQSRTAVGSLEHE